VLKKDIKNVHLSVCPQHGKVKVSALNAMPLDTFRVFIISKLTWIKKQQQKITGSGKRSGKRFCEKGKPLF